MAATPAFSNIAERTIIPNENKENNYNLSSLITRFFENEKISIGEFRTIGVKKEVDGWMPIEAYPFPGSTFSQIYTNVDYYNNTSFLQYENSLLSKEITKEFSVFVIEKDDSKNIENIYFINNFSFRNHITNAKIVFDRTIKAFREGNEDEFVKSSENLSFHIRPKAKNADDTFEFSNGKEITKRTFWANRNLIKEMLSEYYIKQ